MLISKTVKFEAAHRLLNHPGKCRNLHGHSYRVKVTFDGEVDPKTGLVVDFGDISELMNEILNVGMAGPWQCPFDHSTLLQATDPLADVLLADGQRVVRFFEPPTAEAIAKMIAFSICNWRELKREKSFGSAVLMSVEVWETETSVAVWTNPLKEIKGL